MARNKRVKFNIVFEGADQWFPVQKYLDERERELYVELENLLVADAVDGGTRFTPEMSRVYSALTAQARELMESWHESSNNVSTIAYGGRRFRSVHEVHLFDAFRAILSIKLGPPPAAWKTAAPFAFWWGDKRVTAEPMVTRARAHPVRLEFDQNLVTRAHVGWCETRAGAGQSVLRLYGELVARFGSQRMTSVFDQTGVR